MVTLTVFYVICIPQSGLWLILVIEWELGLIILVFGWGLRYNCMKLWHVELRHPILVASLFPTASVWASWMPQSWASPSLSCLYFSTFLAHLWMLGFLGTQSFVSICLSVTFSHKGPWWVSKIILNTLPWDPFHQVLSPWARPNKCYAQASEKYCFAVNCH